MKNVAFVPIKLNNERLPGKNLKRFDNGEPLITYILSTALRVKMLDELYVYCSSENILEYLPKGVMFLKRPNSLDLSSTSITEVIAMFTQMVSADIYVLLHATAPFISVNNIECGLNAIQHENYDSALAVKRHNDFLWRGGKPENYDIHNIPRTQDLEPFYTETTGLYIFSKTLAKQSRRIGDHPFLIEVSDIEAIDINEPIDFEIANAVFNHILLKQENII